MHFETDGVDAAGNELLTVRSRTIGCNTLPVSDKISVDFAREDGTLFAKEVPTRMVEFVGNHASCLRFLCDG